MAGVVVPLYPGVYSAMGLLMSDVKHDYIRSKMAGLGQSTPDGNRQYVFAELESQRRATCATKVSRRTIAIERALDMRYAGQGYEITIPCDYPLIDGRPRAACARASTKPTSRCSAIPRRMNRWRSSLIACGASAACRR